MRRGKYYGIGKYSLWYGYEEKDKNLMRIEWPTGEGYGQIDTKIDPTTITHENNYNLMGADSNRGRVKIRHDMNGMTYIILKRFKFFTYRITGADVRRPGLKLIQQICEINKL